MERPTRDTPPLTVRQLLSHSAGFPEDNPWGDQQLSATDAMLDEWLAKGIPFSTPPGTRYEYSNYAFGLLGRVVTKAAGVPYEQYVHSEILSKLQMDGSTFRFEDVPAARRAVGYRLKPDGTYAEEPPLPHGVFGAMGGLLVTATDLAKYVALSPVGVAAARRRGRGAGAPSLGARDGAPVDAREFDGAHGQRQTAGV